MTNVSLSTLPTELLYRIFNHLDVCSIVLSLRLVCRRFYQITNNYDQYELDLQTVSKFDLKRVLRLVQPENIISLAVRSGWNRSYKNDLFFSLIDITRLIRLRFLTLNRIKYFEDYKLLVSSLISLRIQSSSERENNALQFFSNALTQTTLNQLHLIKSDYTISQIPWPSQSSIQHLSVKSCSLTEYNFILERLPHLRTFRTARFIMNQSMSSSSTPTYYRQLMSLTIGDSSLSMADFDQLLSLTPLISTLKLMSFRSISLDSILNGSEWTHLIQTKLSNLKTFRFFFSYNSREANDAKDIDLIIDQFRTPFWLHEKKWIVVCDYSLNPKFINIYTVPRDVWIPERRSLSDKGLLSSLLTMRFGPTSMDVTPHPIVHLLRIANGIRETPVLLFINIEDQSCSLRFLEIGSNKTESNRSESGSVPYEIFNGCNGK